MNCLRRLLSTSAIVASLLVAAVCSVYTALGQMLPSSQTPASVLDGRAVLENHYEPSQMLRLAIMLTPPHPAEEQQFLEDVQNKQSPLFHQFLKADEWNARFSPSQEDEQAVAAWAASQGLKVTQRYPNRLIVDVEAQAGSIERALHVTINQYRLNAGDPLRERIAYSNDRDPQLPVSLEGIVATVEGLNSVEQMKPSVANARSVPTPDYSPGPVKADSELYQHDASAQEASASTIEPSLAPAVAPVPKGYLTPASFWASSAYDYQALMNLGHCCNPLNNPGNSPPETSIAIATYGDVVPGDVLAFASAFTLASSFEKHFIDGTYVCNNAPGAPDRNCVESTIDAEWAIASANSQTTLKSTAMVSIYEAANFTPQTTSDMFNFILSDGLARTMSTSYGCEEDVADSCRLSTLQGWDSIFSQMVGQGWTLVADSGDNGAVAGCSNALRVQFPASDPNVIAVGGTNLSEGSVSATYEVAWTGTSATGSCAQNGGGSGGGFSLYFPAPAYQQYLGFAKRAVPDVALDAFQPHALYFNGGWTPIGGTSVATPMFAGFFAQENAYLLSLGNKCGSSGTAPCAPLGNANYQIYAEAHNGGAAHFPFYDILSGCNSNDITALYQLAPYCAQAGYDEVTGWGSANMLQLAWSINWQVAAAYGVPYITFKGPAVNKWYHTNQIVSWSVNDFPGAQIAQSSGVGIAGFTQGWDGVGTDSFSEPHGGTNDLFYTGPQFPNATGGCLSLGPGAGCGGGVPTQGCHTVAVHGWNNQGQTTAGQTGYPETYGPVCYDSIPPSLVVDNSGSPNLSGWYNQPVTVSMFGYDTGNAPSGFKQTLYGINSPCNPGGSRLSMCRAYTQPFSLTADGVYNITAYSEDVAGNFSVPDTDVVRLDRTPPVTTAEVLHVNERARIALFASDATSGVLGIFYQLDQGVVNDYRLPFAVITKGKHTLTYWSVDYASNEGAHQSVSFTVR